MESDFFLNMSLLRLFSRLGDSSLKVVGVSVGVMWPLKGSWGGGWALKQKLSHCHVIFVPELKHILHLLLYHCADEKSLCVGSECK